MTKLLTAHPLAAAFFAILFLFSASDTLRAASLASVALDTAGSLAVADDTGTVIPAAVPGAEVNAAPQAGQGLRLGMRRSSGGTSPFAARRSARLAQPAASAAVPAAVEGEEEVAVPATAVPPAPVPAPAPSRRFGSRFSAGQEKPAAFQEGEEILKEGEAAPAPATPQRRFNLGIKFSGRENQPTLPAPYGVNADGTPADANAVKAPNATVYQSSPFKNFRALMTAPRPYLGYDPHVQPTPYMEAPAPAPRRGR